MAECFAISQPNAPDTAARRILSPGLLSPNAQLAWKLPGFRKNAAFHGHRAKFGEIRLDRPGYDSHGAAAADLIHSQMFAIRLRNLAAFPAARVRQEREPDLFARCRAD